MSRIAFNIYGNPKTLKRHRTFRRGSALIQVDPSKSDKQDFLAKAMEYKPAQPIDSKIELTVLFFFQRPKNHYGTGKNAKTLKIDAPNHYTSAPDADNLLKFVCDALNGVFWVDDRLIYSAKVIKAYSDTPRVCLEINF